MPSGYIRYQAARLGNPQISCLVVRNRIIVSHNISSMSQTAHEDLESANNVGVCYLSL
jgi:hypothetical protein